MRGSRKGKGGYPILQGNPESANCCRTLTLTPHTKWNILSIFEKSPPLSMRVSGAEAVSFVPKKLRSEEVNVSFSDFGAGVGLASGRLLRLALDRRAHACRDCVLTQAHR